MNSSITENTLQVENDRLKKILSAASSLNTSLDIQHLLPLIIKSSKDLLDAVASSLFLKDKKHDFLSCEVAVGEMGKMIQQYLRLEIGDGIAGWVAKHQKPLIIPDAYTDPRFDQSWDKITGFITRSIICIPIFIKERFIGTLQVMNKRGEESFSESDLEALQYLGNIAAIALDNARMHEALQVKIRELALLTEIEKKIAEGWSFDQLIEWTLSRTIKVLQAKGGSVLLLSNEKDFLRVKQASGFIKDQITDKLISTQTGIIGISKSERRPVLINNIHADKRFHGQPVQSHESSSMVCSPLKFQEELYGFIIVNDKADGFSFTHEDLESLTNVTERISILLKTSHVFDKMKETSREQETASKLMEKILPTSIPAREGLEIYARYMPYDLIGGDFYRFFELDKNKIGILVVDVSGHGFSAALISVMVNTLISSIPAELLETPAEFFKYLNSSLMNRLHGNFLTGNYMVIDGDAKEVKFANAGHGDLIHYVSESDLIQVENAKGPLLGIKEDPLIEQKEFTVKKGDRLMIYTDGLIEIIGEKDKPEIDQAELLQEIKKYIKLPPHLFTDQITDSLLKKSLKNEFNDDVTIIVVDIG
jgi:serine phosphatase RsbU (regulator of sigma subunit)